MLMLTADGAVCHSEPSDRDWRHVRQHAERVQSLVVQVTTLLSTPLPTTGSQDAPRSFKVGKEGQLEIGGANSMPKFHR